jgi:hypothetical protein
MAARFPAKTGMRTLGGSCSARGIAEGGVTVRRVARALRRPALSATRRLGKRGLLSENDILIFGALGGFVHSDLDYDAITRAFDYQGGQAGGYATYLRGGLFVDTLVNVHLMEIDTGRSLGFSSSLDATTVGVRTDSGYRFGSFNGGAFIEPLATIAVDWADIDGFSLGGNKVSFETTPMSEAA